MSGYFAQTKNPDVEGDDTSYQARFSYDGDRYGAQVEHLLVGDNFNPEVGFLPREDFRRSFEFVRFSPRPRNIKAVRQFVYEGNFNYIENPDGQLETRVGEGRFSTEFNTSDNLTINVAQTYELIPRPFRIATGVSVPAGGYDFTQTTVTYLIGGQRRATVRSCSSAADSTGGHHDVRVHVGTRRNPQAVLARAEPHVQRHRSAADLARHGADSRAGEYSFTPWMFVSGLFQATTRATTRSA